MYYHKSMKRTVLVVYLCLLSVWAVAQSTCETRVDAHPHATTLQRVDYCLQETHENSYNNPGLVFSGVTTRHPATQQPPQQVTARNGHFRPQEMAVTQNFVETRQFPKFADERVSQQEIWAQHRAVYQGAHMGKEAAEKAACEPQDEKTVEKSAVKETKAGLKARTQKPGRRLVKEVVPTEEQVPAPAETAVQEVTTEDDEYAYDNAAVQPYAPVTQDAQEYVPQQPIAQEYEPYAPAQQEEIPVGTSSYEPAN